MNTNYFHPDSTNPITRDYLKNLDKNEQIKVMKQWFYSNYENPAEHTPYESKEGGYIYIWGGPYYVKEELEIEFYGIVSDDAIDELAEELESESYEWAGKPSDKNYDDYYYEVISANAKFHGTLTENLNNIRKLLNINLAPDLNNLLNMMLFVNVITALETFLSDAFVGIVIGNERLTRKFVSSNTDFSDRKLSLNEIFDRMDNVKKEVRNYLLDLIWHNLAKVKNIYKNTLGIDFSPYMNNLYEAVAKRHDIVHRSGKTKDGNAIIVTRDQIEKLMQEVKSFADHINSAWEYKIFSK